MTNSLMSSLGVFISEILAMLTDNYLTFWDIFMCKYRTKISRTCFVSVNGLLVTISPLLMCLCITLMSGNNKSSLEYYIHHCVTCVLI